MFGECDRKLVRYSPGGIDVTMHDKNLIDFVEVCFSFKPDNDDINVRLRKTVMGWVDALSTLKRMRMMEDVLCYAVLRWVKDKFPHVQAILGQDQMLFFVGETGLYITPCGPRLRIFRADIAEACQRWVGEIDLHDPNSKDELLCVAGAYFGKD
jgi:hypothetical protein